MKDKKIEIIAPRVERELLPFVRKPARYIGGEVNQVRKDLNHCGLTVALCFPDVYDVYSRRGPMPKKSCDDAKSPCSAWNPRPRWPDSM
jgi:hypothetical protein